MGNVYFQIFFPDISLKAPVTKISGAWNIEVNNTLEITKELISEEIRKNQPLAKLKDQIMNYGYRRFHPLYGVQHIVQVTVHSANKYRNKTKLVKPKLLIFHRREASIPNSFLQI